MNNQKVYDIIGIGIGPFNLGLAALAHDLPELKCLFFDSKEQFDWHPGMLIPGTRMQVPFYADLVTFADPCNTFNYLNYLKAKQRMIRFGVLESIFPLRTEFNNYCRWVAGELPSLHFGHLVDQVRYLDEQHCYEVTVINTMGKTQFFHCRHIVIGVGTVPLVPACAANVTQENILHSSEYLLQKEQLLKQNIITLIGSGQSAAEIFYDLLQHTNEWKELYWYTSSERIFPMDYSKFALEMASPAYIEHFYQLPEDIKAKVLESQADLHRGINVDTIAAIYDQLHLLEALEGSTGRIVIQTGMSLRKVNREADNKLTLNLYHKMTGTGMNQKTSALILATGYHYKGPECIKPIRHQIVWTEGKQYAVKENYAVDANDTIFVQNADFHTHGFNSAELGMGPYRNARILNTILRREQYRMEKGNVFQRFD